MEYDLVEVEDFEGGEQDGLMKVLNTKQRQIDLLQKKIEKMEKDNDKFDKMGKMKEQEVQSPRFEINFVVSSCKGK